MTWPHDGRSMFSCPMTLILDMWLILANGMLGLSQQEAWNAFVWCGLSFFYHYKKEQSKLVTTLSVWDTEWDTDWDTQSMMTYPTCSLESSSAEPKGPRNLWVRSINICCEKNGCVFICYWSIIMAVANRSEHMTDAAVSWTFLKAETHQRLPPTALYAYKESAVFASMYVCQLCPLF